MKQQSKYVIEDLGNGNKQISRFSHDGNRVVVIKVECQDVDHEMNFILDRLNFGATVLEHTTREPKHENKRGK